MTRKSSEITHFVVGLVTIVVVIVGLSIVAVIAEPYYFSPKITTETYFSDSINGLEVGNAVKFRGVPVGQIVKIGLTSEIYQQDQIPPFEERESLAVVRMLLYFNKSLFTEQLPKYISQGLRAQTQLANLTGTQYISLDFLEPGKYPVRRHPYPWTPAYPVIPSAPSLTNEILSSMENFLAGLSDVHLDDKFKDTLPAIQSLILQLDRLAENLAGDQINTVLANANNFLETADKKVEAFSVQNINNIVKSLDKSAEELTALATGPETDKLVNQMHDLSAKFNSFATGNQYSVRQLMNSLVQVTGGIADFTRELSNNPGLFLTRRAQRTLPSF